MRGNATCLTNAPFELAVDLGRDVGNGPLRDGGTVPALIRYPPGG